MGRERPPPPRYSRHSGVGPLRPLRRGGQACEGDRVFISLHGLALFLVLAGFTLFLALAVLVAAVLRAVLKGPGRAAATRHLRGAGLALALTLLADGVALYFLERLPIDTQTRRAVIWIEESGALFLWIVPVVLAWWLGARPPGGRRDGLSSAG